MKYCRAALGWFAHEPEWYEADLGNFAQSEAQSVSTFVQFLQNQINNPNGSSLVDMVN